MMAAHVRNFFWNCLFRKIKWKEIGLFTDGLTCWSPLSDEKIYCDVGRGKNEFYYIEGKMGKTWK